jgi:hypothetical protein
MESTMARARLSRRWTVPAVLLVLLLLALASPLACTTTVIAPAAPADPVPVFLVDYGMTSAVALPHGGGLAVYAYGDWQYYALADNTAWRGVAALAWPTQGAIGRGRLRGPATAASVMAQLQGRGAEAVHVVQAERASVERLIARIDRAYEDQRLTEVENAGYGMHFVQYPQRYTWFWNSNHQAAAWLEELGCEIRGPAFASRWRIREAGQ